MLFLIFQKIPTFRGKRVFEAACAHRLAAGLTRVKRGIAKFN